MDDKQKALQQSLDRITEVYTEVFAEMKQEQEDYWNSLTKEQQLMAFCAVCRRICEGELVNKGSYRYVLYQVFGFGPEAYAAAQDAGYLELHNAILDDNYDRRMLTAFCTINKVEDFEKKIDDYFL